MNYSVAKSRLAKDDRLLRVDQVAKRLQFDKSYIYVLIDQGTLEGIPVVGVRVPLSSLKAYVKRRIGIDLGDNDNLLTIQQVTARLNCSKQSAYRLLEIGELRGGLLGNKRGTRFLESSLENYIARKRAEDFQIEPIRKRAEDKNGR